MPINPDSQLSFSPLHRLQWEEAQQKHVILYPEGMVELSSSATEILKLCDGAHTLELIVSDLENKFDTTGLRKDVLDFLDTALINGWITQN